MFENFYLLYHAGTQGKSIVLIIGLTKDDAYKELRIKACELGGDAVIVDDYMENCAAKMTHVHASLNMNRSFKIEYWVGHKTATYNHRGGYP